MQEKLAQLKERLGEIQDLTQASMLLEWDQQTIMPPRAADARSSQLATLTKITHQKFTDPAIGKLLDSLQAYGESLPYESDDAALLRFTRREYEKLTKVPEELATELTRAGSQAYGAWVKAKQESDFGHFLPHLQRIVDLKFKYIECLDAGQETPYDVLLDDYEPGMKTSEVRACFDELKVGLIPLLAAIRERQDVVDDSLMRGHFPPADQERFSRKVLEQLGASWEAWRLDPTVHPFATGTLDDIRVTTHYNPDDMSVSVFGTIHEFGHGLYEHQISHNLARTPLCRGTSMSIHESQSRTWENLVGRSKAFWQFMFPTLQATYPDQFGKVDLDAYYAAINKVEPSYIRIHADEATYPLHIILRFELEQEIFEGKLALTDLPEVWNARFKSYMGLDVPDNAHGVLQDVHWSFGGMGYFPTYALGSIVASQLWEKITREIPDLEEQFARGEFGALREWLCVNIHQHGSKFTSSELLQRVLGTGIEVQPYLRYLSSKFGTLYGVSTQA
jgi:carboxypeptidase Taq